MSQTRLFVFISALVATLEGCAGDAGSAGPAAAGGGAALEPQQQMAKFCVDVVGPYCRAMFACCTTSDATRLSLGGTEAACETQFGAECRGSITDNIVRHIEAGETELDQARLAACVAKLESMKTGGAACSAPPEFVLSRDCFGALVGKLAAGAACETKGLDLSFIVCDKGSCDQGKCVPFLAVGAACQNPNVAAGGCDYVAGQFCRTSGGAGECAPVGKPGDAVCQPKTDQGFSCDSATCDATGAQCIAPTPERLCKRL
jgi:hypothetical protein